ncbi:MULTISPECIES: transposase [unclassified Streptomyces]|uniref:transposase n=1 Tax=unclassified Streptomyces TaxID=2593676 RepID=UPI0033AFA536
MPAYDAAAGEQLHHRVATPDPAQRDGQAPARPDRRVPQPAPGRRTVCVRPGGVDALTHKVRKGRRTLNAHALTAAGVNAHGHHKTLDIHVTTPEDAARRLAFQRSPTPRSPPAVQLIVSDTHTGPVNAPGTTLPSAPRQQRPTLPHTLNTRRATPITHNPLSQTPKSAQPRAATPLRTISEQPDTDTVKAQMRHALHAPEAKSPKAATHIDTTQVRPRRAVGQRGAGWGRGSDRVDIGRAPPGQPRRRLTLQDTPLGNHSHFRILEENAPGTVTRSSSAVVTRGVLHDSGRVSGLARCAHHGQPPSALNRPQHR